MKDIRRFAGPGLMLFAVLCTATQASAAVPLANPILSGTTYTYGDTTCTFSACSVGAISCSQLEVLPIMNGRGGTEIEIASNATSDIFSQQTGTANTTLSFRLTVGLLAGNRGISSVTNILEGSDTTSPGGVASTTNNGRVTSVLSSFTPTGLGGSQSSDLTTTSSKSTFAAVNAIGSSFSFIDTLANNSGSAGAGFRLKLTDVKLLFNPAPEPASMALLATGLAGLMAARRRRAKR